jgi:hypothetical protein
MPNRVLDGEGAVRAIDVSATFLAIDLNLRDLIVNPVMALSILRRYDCHVERFSSNRSIRSSILWMANCSRIVASYLATQDGLEEIKCLHAG